MKNKEVRFLGYRLLRFHTASSMSMLSSSYTGGSEVNVRDQQFSNSKTVE